MLEAIPPDRPVSLEREVWPDLLDGRLRGLVMDGAFTDMGVPDAFAALQADPSPLLAHRRRGARLMLIRAKAPLRI